MVWTYACPSEIRINYLSCIWFNYKILLWMVPFQGSATWVSWLRFLCPHFRILGFDYLTNTPLIQYRQVKRCITTQLLMILAIPKNRVAVQLMIVNFICRYGFQRPYSQMEFYSWTAKESSLWSKSDQVWLLHAGCQCHVTWKLCVS